MDKTGLNMIPEVYVLSMCTVFLLAFGPQGYGNITGVKWAVFCGLTGLYLVMLIRALCRSGKKPGKPEGAEFCLLGYLFFTALSAACSPWPGIALLGGGRNDGALTVCLYVLIALSLSRFARPGKRMLRVFAAAMTIYCAVCLLQLCDRNPLGLFPGELRWSGRERAYNGAFLGFTGNADMSAAVLGMGFCLFLSGAVICREWWLFVPAAGCGGVLVLAGLRGGLLSAAGGTVLTLPGLLRLDRKKRWIYWAALALAVLAALTVVYLVPAGGTLGELHAMLRGEWSDSYASGRIYIWKQVLPLAGQRPLMGFGADTLGQQGLQFTKSLPDGGVLERSIDCAHSEYLNIWVNQGLPALLCLLGGAGFTWEKSRKTGGRAAIPLRGAFLAYGISALTGVSMPGSTAFFWICWGLLGAFCRKDERTTSRTEEEKK